MSAEVRMNCWSAAVPTNCWSAVVQTTNCSSALAQLNCWLCRLCPHHNPSLLDRLAELQAAMHSCFTMNRTALLLVRFSAASVRVQYHLRCWFLPLLYPMDS